jgi:hypothetical protein
MIYDACVIGSCAMPVTLNAMLNQPNTTTDTPAALDWLNSVAPQDPSAVLTGHSRST